MFPSWIAIVVSARREDQRQQAGEKATDPSHEQPGGEWQWPLVGNHVRQHRSERERHEHIAEGAAAHPDPVPRDREHERAHGGQGQGVGADAERRDHAGHETQAGHHSECRRQSEPSQNQTSTPGDESQSKRHGDLAHGSRG